MAAAADLAAIADLATTVAVMATVGLAAADLAVATPLPGEMATITEIMDSPLWAADARKQPRFREMTAAVETITRESAVFRMEILPTGRIIRRFPAGRTVIAINETIAT